MGHDKALLELQGQPLLLRAVELLRPQVAEVTLLGPLDRYARFGIAILADRQAGRGPLAALCRGLEYSRHDWNIFLACDLPFLDGRFLDFLVRRALAGSADAVVPCTPDGWQPLCAAYHRRCLPRMQPAVAKTDAGIVDVLKGLAVDAVRGDQVAAVGLSEEIFTNINTVEDWEAVQHRLERKPA